MIEENKIKGPKPVLFNSPYTKIPQYASSQKRQNFLQDIDTEEEKRIGTFNDFQFTKPYSSSSNPGQNIFKPQSISPAPSCTFNLPSYNVSPNTSKNFNIQPIISKITTTSKLNSNPSFSAFSPVPSQNFTIPENLDFKDPTQDNIFGKDHSPLNLNPAKNTTPNSANKPDN